MLKSIMINSIAPKVNRKLRHFIYYSLYKLDNSEQIRRNVYIQNVDALKIGQDSFINSYVKIYNGFDSRGRKGLVTIGNNVSIGYGATIITTTHKIGTKTRRADYRDIVYKEVRIGDGSWICANVTILPGVSIGKGCVIAAGSVVVKNCESNGLYGGNPAKKIRNL